MKKMIIRVILYLSVVYTITALEITVPKFNFSVSTAKQPDEQKFGIVQESSINLRLLHGERFYGDLGLSLHLPDIIHFFHPQQQERSLGQFVFVDFSLNFPRLGGNPLSLSVFTGRHPSLSGAQYGFDFLKHGIRPVGMYTHASASSFLPPAEQESVGISFAGLVSNTGYLGFSFGWNAQIGDKQEYGIYMQGGTFSHTALIDTSISVHLTERLKALSLNTALSVLFTIHDNFSIFTQFGLHKTDFRSATLKEEALGNIFAFFEPRIHTTHSNFDFTFFASKMNDKSSVGFFPATPLLKPFNAVYNEPYGGLNIFCGFGNREIDTLQGGLHLLAAVRIKKPKDVSSMLIAATPFFTVNIGLCDLDFRVSVYPLAYATPLSMFEGKVSLKRDL